MIIMPNLILDPPGRAFLQKDVETVIKGDSLTLTCGVDELGRPRAKEYIWRMGGKVVNHVSSSNWTIDPVTLETEGNISCVAKNPVGLGIPDFIDVEVFGKFCSISIKSNSRIMFIHVTYMHICSNCLTQLVQKHVNSEEQKSKAFI